MQTVIVQPKPEGKRYAMMIAGKIAKAGFRTGFRASRWVSRRGYTYRRKLAPVYTAIALQTTAWGLHNLPGGEKTSVALTALGAVAVGGWMHWWRPKTGRPLKQHETWWKDRVLQAWALYGAGAAWTLTAVATTPGPPMNGFLLAATLATGGAWWWHHRIRPQTTVVDATDIESTWEKKIGAPNGVAPGTTVSEVQAIEHGTVATIDLSDSNLLASDLLSKRPAIAKAFKAARSSVVVELMPQQYEHLAKLMILDKNPVDEDVVYDETWRTLEEGCYPMALLPDGERTWARLYQPGSGVVHEIFSGDTRTGKSRGMSLSILQSVFTGLVIPIVCDPQGGQSLPAWAGAEGKAPYTACDMDAILDYLMRLRRVMYVRSKELARTKWIDEDGFMRTGLDHYDPIKVPHMPILDNTIDEAHRVFALGDEAKNLMEESLLMSSKNAIRHRLATQYPSITQLGNSMPIRNSLVAGNVYCYRIATSVAKGMLLPPGLPDPAHIPKLTPTGLHTKGTCVIDSTAPGGGRAAYARTAFVKNEHRMAEAAVRHIPEMDEPSLEAWHKVEKPQRSDVKATAPAEKIPVFKTDTERVLEHLRNRNAPVHTGVIARELNIALGSVSTILKRQAGKGLVVKVRHGVWEAAEVAAKPVLVAA